MAMINDMYLTWATGHWHVQAYMFHTKVMNGSVVVKTFRGFRDIERAWDWVGKNVPVNLDGWN